MATRAVNRAPVNSQPEEKLIEAAQVVATQVVPDEFKEKLAALLPADRAITVSWDPTTEHGAWLLQKCEEDQDEKLRTLIGQKIMLRDWMSKKIPDYVDKETGEVRPITRVVLVTTDDEVLGCSSGGIAESVARLCIRYGRWRFPDGLRVEIQQKLVDEKRVRMFLLEEFPNYNRKGKK